MNKQIFSTDKAPAAIGPYSQSIAFGDLVFTSGQLPIDPVTNAIPEGVEAQAEQALKNVNEVLKAAGSSMDKALKVTVFMQDMGHFAAVNAIYQKHFEKDCPCRSAVQVARLPKDALIEIEAIAHR